jgi:hypothetical protein
MKLVPQLSAQDTLQIMTRQDIYKKAIENYSRSFPQFKAVYTISSLIFVSPKKLYSILEGERNFSLEEEENFFRVCMFPEGLVLKQRLIFPEVMPVNEAGLKRKRARSVKK